MKFFVNVDQKIWLPELRCQIAAELFENYHFLRGEVVLRHRLQDSF